MSPQRGHISNRFAVPAAALSLTVVRALSLLGPDVLRWARSHTHPPSALLADFFLGWTNCLAADLAIPHLVFYSSGNFTVSIINYLWPRMPRREDGDGPAALTVLSELPSSPVFPFDHLPGIWRRFRAGEPWKSNVAGSGRFVLFKAFFKESGLPLGEAELLSCKSVLLLVAGPRGGPLLVAGAQQNPSLLPPLSPPPPLPPPSPPPPLFPSPLLLPPLLQAQLPIPCQTPSPALPWSSPQPSPPGRMPSPAPHPSSSPAPSQATRDHNNR